MFDTIFGLPVHALVIHATVVMLPLASLLVLGAAFIPKFRRWAGPVPLGASIISLILVPISTQSGEALKAHGFSGPLVQKHQDLAGLLIFWVLGLVIAAAALYWIHRQSKKSDSSATPSQAIVIAVMVISAVAGVGTLVHVARVGDAGARAVWEGTGSS